MERALNQNESFDIDNKELKTIIFIEKIENSQFEKEISKIRKIYLNKKLNQKDKTNKLISKYLNKDENEKLNIKHKKNKSEIIFLSKLNFDMIFSNSIINQFFISYFLSSNRSELLN